MDWGGSPLRHLTMAEQGLVTLLIQVPQTCTPLFFSADPISTGVNCLFIVALLMAALKGQLCS